jgi:hypothetical protein
VTPCANLKRVFSQLFQGALPIGLLMFVFTAFTFLRRRRERQLATRDLPSLAAELGLTHVAPRYNGAQGQLRGTFQGRSVIVDPDDRRRLLVRFNVAPPVDLRRAPPESAPRRGWVLVHSKSRAFNSFFRTRVAAPELAEALAQHSAVEPLLAPFLTGEFSRVINEFAIGQDGVSCRLDYGTPPYFPVAAIRELLPACCAWADTIEAVHAAAPAVHTSSDAPSSVEAATSEAVH